LMSAGLMAGTHFLLLLILYLFAALATFAGFEIHRSQQFFAGELQTRAIQTSEERTSVRSPNEQTEVPSSTSPPIIELWRESKERRRPLRTPGGLHLTGFSAVALISILLTAVPLFLLVP